MDWSHIMPTMNIENTCSRVPPAWCYCWSCSRPPEAVELNGVEDEEEEEVMLEENMEVEPPPQMEGRREAVKQEVLEEAG